MEPRELRENIQHALQSFSSKPLADAANSLFESLGYHSQKRLTLKPNTAETFIATFAKDKPLNPDKALLVDWESVDFLFQLTEDEVNAGGQGSLAFTGKGKWDGSVIESYLFLAINLKKSRYTRTELAGITRAVNRLFPMPAMLLFQHGHTLTLAIINRRLSRRDESKDVLEKVTLIKDIRFADPHRAHIDILSDLSFDVLHERHDFANFVALHRAWRETLDIQALNRGFFIEIRNWFYWARLHARFPAGAKKDADKRDSEALIRLLTRMIFCWFLREKRLLPDDLFAERTVETLMCDWHAADCEKDKQGRYFKAILQNLFFATLNTPIEERKFRSNRSYQGKNKHYGDQRYFRHVALFHEKAPVEDLYKTIPFLNGGLFEMLDEIPGRGDDSIKEEKRVDGFSDVVKNQPFIPDFLFFGKERRVPELSTLLGETAAPKARGLLNIFRDYKFTIEENTPLEQDIALDPELLGRAFENLLAAVNPETGTVARKSTGSFYTPREIVNYMVEESVFRHLSTALSAQEKPFQNLEERLRELVSAEKESHHFKDVEADAIVAAVGRMRILDPACGSGAFPMGLLQRLVHMLHKLDPGNVRWKAAKLSSLPPEMREKAEEVFRKESFDYTRKLELIKDCIHGVDIQPAAIQISKLRFFLSLVIEQNDPRHMRPLPNLETKFVCANSLLGLPRPEGWELFQHQIEPHEKALLDARARYFFAQNQKEKDACRAEGLKLRRKLSNFIEGIGGSSAHELASAVAAWDPYKPDRVAGYFDPESMFGVSDGFDITIGNPPYVRAEDQSEWNQSQRKQILAGKQFETLWEKWDLFVPFIERAYKLLRPGGITTLIVSDAFCHSKYAQKSQNWFLQNARILRLDFCSDLQIFDAAVHNLIYFFQRADGAHGIPDRRVHHETFGKVLTLPSEKQPKLTYRVFFPEDTSTPSFTSRCVILEKISNVTYGMGVHAHDKFARAEFLVADLVSQKKDAIHSKAFVEGKDLHRWVMGMHNWLEWDTERAPAKFRRPTFYKLYDVPEKILILVIGGERVCACYDNQRLLCNDTVMVCTPWFSLAGVRNQSLKKTARYKGERPPRPDLPEREELETMSRRFAVKYLLGVMNSSAARDFLRANRRSNIHLYPDDWKKLPIPDVGEKEQAPIIKLVDKILAAKRADPDADISAMEADMDTKINVLYGIAVATTKTTTTTALPFFKTKRTEAGMKELLRGHIVPKLTAQAPYFSIEAVRAEFEAARCPLEPATLNSYLHELTDARFIFDAGRGWYSSLSTPFTLNLKPVSSLVQELNKAFPLLEFSCWSTEQVASYGHHLLAKFVSFVHTKRESMRSVFEFLQDKGFDAHLNPRGAATNQFAVREKTVVVRPRVTTQPADGGFVTIEGLLVDLFVECHDLGLMDTGEYFQLFNNLMRQARITMSTLVDYARQRKTAAAPILESIKAEFSKNSQLIDSR